MRSPFACTNFFFLLLVLANNTFAHSFRIKNKFWNDVKSQLVKAKGILNDDGSFYFKDPTMTIPMPKSSGLDWKNKEFLFSEYSAPAAVCQYLINKIELQQYYDPHPGSKIYYDSGKKPIPSSISKDHLVLLQADGDNSLIQTTDRTKGYLGHVTCPFSRYENPQGTWPDKWKLKKEKSGREIFIFQDPSYNYNGKKWNFDSTTGPEHVCNHFNFKYYVQDSAKKTKTSMTVKINFYRNPITFKQNQKNLYKIKRIACSNQLKLLSSKPKPEVQQESAQKDIINREDDSEKETDQHNLIEEEIEHIDLVGQELEEKGKKKKKLKKVKSIPLMDQ